MAGFFEDHFISSLVIALTYTSIIILFVVGVVVRIQGTRSQDDPKTVLSVTSDICCRTGAHHRWFVKEDLIDGQLTDGYVVVCEDCSAYKIDGVCYSAVKATYPDRS